MTIHTHTHPTILEAGFLLLQYHHLACLLSFRFIVPCAPPVLHLAHTYTRVHLHTRRSTPTYTCAHPPSQAAPSGVSWASLLEGFFCCQAPLLHTLTSRSPSQASLLLGSVHEETFIWLVLRASCLAASQQQGLGGLCFCLPPHSGSLASWQSLTSRLSGE